MIKQIFAVGLGYQNSESPAEAAEELEPPMFTEFLFIAVTAALLYSLIASTEQALARRAQRVEKEARIIDHRSRM